MPDTILAGPVNKQKVSTGWSGIATRNIDINEASRRPMSAVAAIDFYVSDFGTFKVLPNRFHRERDLWFINFDFLSVSTLRNFRTEKLAKTGDAEKRMLLIEYGIKVKNEAAHALAADLTTT